MNITSKPEDFHAADAYRTRLPGEERLTPRRDPVLWSDWTGDAPITRQEAAHYEEKGYLIRRNLFSDAELRLLIDTSHRLRAAADANALIVVPEGSSTLVAGDIVEVIAY